MLPSYKQAMLGFWTKSILTLQHRLLVLLRNVILAKQVWYIFQLRIDQASLMMCFAHTFTDMGLNEMGVTERSMKVAEVP